MDLFDLEFIEYSLICDDPKLLERIKNRYYDPEFDEWLEEFDEEQRQTELKNKKEQESKQQDNLDLPDSETIQYKPKPQNIVLTEDYEIGDRSQITDDDWEIDD